MHKISYPTIHSGFAILSTTEKLADKTRNEITDEIAFRFGSERERLNKFLECRERVTLDDRKKFAITINKNDEHNPASGFGYSLHISGISVYECNAPENKDASDLAYFEVMQFAMAHGVDIDLHEAYKCDLPKDLEMNLDKLGQNPDPILEAMVNHSASRLITDLLKNQTDTAHKINLTRYGKLLPEHLRPVFIENFKLTPSADKSFLAYYGNSAGSHQRLNLINRLDELQLGKHFNELTIDMCNSCIGIEWGEYNVLNEYLENRRLVMTPGGPEISKVDPSVKTLSRLV